MVDTVKYGLKCLLFYFSIEVCMAYNVTILYDKCFEKDIKYLRSSLALNNLTLSNVRYREVSKNDTLQNLTKLMFSENDFIFSFFKRHAPAGDLQRNHVAFGTSLFELGAWVNNTEFASCIKYTQSYRSILISLVYSVFLKGVVLISDESHCSKHFSDNLMKDLRKAERNNKVNLNLHHVKLTLHPRHREELKEQFYILKTSEVSLVILLSAHENMQDVFRHASYFDLTGPAQVWLIPNYKDGVSSSFIPLRIISFSEDEDDIIVRPYMKLTTTIPRLLAMYDGYMNTCIASHPSCILSKLYETIQLNEHYVEEELHMTVRYRNLAEGDYWTSVHAELKKNQFIIQHNTIPILRSVSGDKVRRFLRAVTILDSPYTIEETHMLDPVQQSCKVGIICRKPVSVAGNKSVHYEVTCCVGFVIEFFQILIEELNLDIDMYIVEDGKYGIYQDGEWNGLIRDVESGKADIAVAGLTITGERSRFIDYTVPYMEAQMGILVKPQIVRLEFLNWDFIAPLSGELQLTLWVVVVGAMVLNYIFENNLYALSLTDCKFKFLKYYPTFESMTYISGVTLQRDLGGVNPVRAGARVSAIVFAFGMVIVVTTYTAVLAAQSVQNQEKNPFLGSKDPRMRNPTSEFTFGTIKSSSYESFFQNGETEILKRMGNFMKPYNVKNTEEGFQRVSNGTLDALIDDYQFLYYYLSRDSTCQIRLVRDALLETGLAFGIKRGQSLKLLLDAIVLKHVEQETLVQLQKKWFPSICQPSLAMENHKLSINHFGGLIMLLISTAFSAVLLLYPERIYYKYIDKYISRKLENVLDEDCRKTNQGHPETLTLNRSLVQNDVTPVMFRYNPESTEDIKSKKETMK
ncbi:glutamate receptor ionotropic, NMDA 2B-like isoform X2 [Hydractinia symbiolongicarpus]|uniref:glutamate receptor ionotropic, NMDA 2B-like isoform X2 n=1 Tax=Hydractinia symbiolongicarpus TaxID=13093 RepID=UPI00254AC4E1|nr:glutamate receptor ionotropic, NMDA 2B-like isoform X2 [Hydractinia symbiolongicarpus]